MLPGIPPAARGEAGEGALAVGGQGLYCQMGDTGPGFSWVAEKDVLSWVLAVVKGGRVIPLEGPAASLETIISLAL